MKCICLTVGINAVSHYLSVTVAVLGLSMWTSDLMYAHQFVQKNCIKKRVIGKKKRNKYYITNVLYQINAFNIVITKANISVAIGIEWKRRHTKQMGNDIIIKLIAFIILLLLPLLCYCYCCCCCCWYLLWLLAIAIFHVRCYVSLAHALALVLLFLLPIYLPVLSILDCLHFTFEFLWVQNFGISQTNTYESKILFFVHASLRIVSICADAADGSWNICECICAL